MESLNVNKLVILFVLGAFLGEILETLFCRIAGKKWMNRSTYIFWPLSSVWGGAFLLASISYYWLRNSTILLIFVAGFLFGSLYEYFYSAVLEKVFSVKFWDYSGFRYHIKGRVNLPYSIGWGVIAVLWMRVIYPTIEEWMNGMSSSVILAAGIALAMELIIDTIITLFALFRYSHRFCLSKEKKGESKSCISGRLSYEKCSDKSKKSVSALVDGYFTDAYMEEIFPYMLRVEKRKL